MAFKRSGRLSITSSMAPVLAIWRISCVVTDGPRFQISAAASHSIRTRPSMQSRDRWAEIRLNALGQGTSALQSHLSHPWRILLALCAALFLLSACGSRWPEPKTIETVYGNKLEVLSEGWEQGTNTRGERAYKLVIVAPHDSDRTHCETLRIRPFRIMRVRGPSCSAFARH